MGKRYGGKYSPDRASDGQTTPATNRFRNQRAANVHWAARMLFILPLPLLVSGIFEIMSGDAFGMIVELGGFAAFMLSAWLLNEGIKAEDAYNARKIARPPSFPRKIASACLTGLTVAGVTMFTRDGGLLQAIPFGVVASVAQVFAFGTDPMTKKGLEGVNEFETERVAKAIDKAEGLVAQIMDASRRIGDRQLEDRIERLCAQARDVFRVVEEDPRDLPRARKFLSVYLMGARDATAKFADLYSRSRNQQAKADYEALLSDLETSFSSHKERLLLEDRSDLDIEIDVLRQRLKQEGLTA